MQRPPHYHPHRTYSKDSSKDTGRIGRKTEDVLAEDQFGFGRENGTRDEIGMLWIISERTMNIEEELCVCVRACVLQRLAESICKCKLDQINRDPEGNWYRQARAKSEQQLCMDQSVKIKLYRAKTRSVKSWTRMSFVADSIRLVQRIPDQGSYGKVWRLQNRRTSNSQWNMQTTSCYWLRKKWCYRAWLMD